MKRFNRFKNYFYLLCILSSLLLSQRSFATNFNETEAFALTGNALLVQGGQTKQIEKNKVPIAWSQGFLKTDNLSSVIVTDMESGRLGLLPSSQFEFFSQDSKSFKIQRHGKLEKGGVRFKGSGRATQAGQSYSVERAKIQTNEIQVIVPMGGDVGIYREYDPVKNKFFTSVVVMNGLTYIEPNEKLLGKNAERLSKRYNLRAGLQFMIYEDGTILPISPPKKSVIDNFIAFTTVDAKEIAAQIKEESSEKDLLNLCQEDLRSGEYFEIISTIEPNLISYKNNPDLTYCVGSAYKELFQYQEAREKFTQTIALNNNYGLAYWSIAQINLEEKKYKEAVLGFDSAEQELSTDLPQTHELNYYRGVASFLSKNLIAAKGDLSVAVFDTNLDQSMRSSAAEFLNKIDVDKPWTLNVPVGLQYDSNVLSLAQNESLPTAYSSKATLRALAGAIYSYDTLRTNKNEGLFLGYGAKIFAMRNLNSDYRFMDPIVIEGTFAQTNRKKNGKDFKLLKIYETAGIILLNNKKDTIYGLVGVASDPFELSGGLEYDVSTRSNDDKKTGIVFNQYYRDYFYKKDKFVFNGSAQLKEKFFFKRNENQDHLLEVIATPALTHNTMNDLNLKGSLILDFTWTFTSPLQTLYKITPTISSNYFIKKWLLATAEAGYEYSIKNEVSNRVRRPQASLILTGAF